MQPHTAAGAVPQPAEGALPQTPILSEAKVRYLLFSATADDRMGIAQQLNQATTISPALLSDILICALREPCAHVRGELVGILETVRDRSPLARTLLSNWIDLIEAPAPSRGYSLPAVPPSRAEEQLSRRRSELEKAICDHTLSRTTAPIEIRTASAAAILRTEEDESSILAAARRLLQQHSAVEVARTGHLADLRSPSALTRGVALLRLSQLGQLATDREIAALVSRASDPARDIRIHAVQLLQTIPPGAGAAIRLALLPRVAEERNPGVRGTLRTLFTDRWEGDGSAVFQLFNGLARIVCNQAVSKENNLFAVEILKLAAIGWQPSPTAGVARTEVPRARKTVMSVAIGKLLATLPAGSRTVQLTALEAALALSGMTEEQADRAAVTAAGTALCAQPGVEFTDRQRIMALLRGLR